MNISALRTYALLQSALFQLLTEMPFEKITLTRLCARSMVPRSTFYRYFEDKYDLLRYCLRRFFEESRLDEDVIYLKNQESTQAFIAKVITVISRTKGLRLNISCPIFTYLLADLFLSVGTCYLEYGDDYAVDAFVADVSRFASRAFFSDSPASQNGMQD